MKAVLFLLFLSFGFVSFGQWDGDAAARFVQSKMGTPYKKGGATWAEGVDAVHMVHLVYREQGIELPLDLLKLYSVPGKGIKHLRNLKKGDLVFFKRSGTKPITEVGLYVGQGKAAVVANFGRKRVRLVSLRNDRLYSSSFVLGKRPSEKETVENESSKRPAITTKPRKNSRSTISASAQAKKLVTFALSKKSTPYKYGGSSWKSGVDCSGFTMLVFQESAGITLPHSAKLQFAKTGKRILKKAELLPGDLLFFDIAGKGTIAHVGIYIGENEFIHAPSSGKTVSTSTLKDHPYWASKFRGALRLLD